MVARIVSGKSIRGILNYNENKVKNAEAKILLACGFPRDPESLSFKNKLDRFEMLTRQNEGTKTNALHISLNFSRNDQLSEDLLRRVALDYMDAIGFGNQPFLVYQHFDAAHPHIHLATVNVADGGGRIETHNIGRNQSEKARKEIEYRFGLIKAEDQVKEMNYMLRPVNLEKIAYGKMETKAAISAIVREVTGNYKFTSLPELNAVLGQFNVMAHRGAQDTKMYEKGGLVYCITGEDGEPLGIPIKASSIYSSPTLKNLEKKFAPNKEARKPYGLRLKHLLDKVVSTASTLEELEASLRQKGIRILLRRNVQGNVYGVTFIDNATRSVFNGSDLGKAYSAKAFMERLETAGYTNEPAAGIQSPKSITDRSNYHVSEDRKTNAASLPNAPYPAQEQSVIEVLWDIALSDKYEETTPNPFRKKRKKLGME
jgi:hypothetical protein